MKKILSTLAMLLVISLGSTTFVACSSDDDKEEAKVDVAEILGSWEETHVKSGDKTTTEVVTSWYVITPAFDKYGQNQQDPKFQQQTQIRWYDNLFSELLTIVGLNKQISLNL